MLGTVFVVDDEPLVRRSIVDLLSMIDVQTASFDSTESLLVEISTDNDSPRCVIADLRMPGLSGLDLKAELTKRGSDIPVVLLTGYRDDETDDRAKQLGIFAILDKPHPPGELISIVKSALGAATTSSESTS